MPIEIRELVIKSTVRSVQNAGPKPEYLTKEDLVDYDRRLQRSLKRQIQKEVKEAKRRR